MSDQDYYDLQDYPETPVAEKVTSDVWKLVEHCQAGTLTYVEVAAQIVAYVETLDPSVRVDLRREHAASVAWDDGQGRAADYARLKADLQRGSAVTHWLLDRMRGANTRD